MSPAADRDEVEQLTLDLLDRYEEINLVYDIGQALAGVFDVDAIGRTVVDRAMAVTRAESRLFLAVEAEAARVGYRAGDLPEPLLAVCVQRDAGVFRLIALAGEELEPAPDASE